MVDDDDSQDRLREAFRPLLERLGASLVEPDQLGERDVPVRWGDALVAGVRLPEVDEAAAGLDVLIGAVEQELGGSLSDLPRDRKQRAVRLLEERGAFSYRKAVETVAQALGVTRFTVYNYLNRQRG